MPNLLRTLRKTYRAVIRKGKSEIVWHTEARTKRQARRIFERRMQKNLGQRYVMNVYKEKTMTPTRKGLRPRHHR